MGWRLYLIGPSATSMHMGLLSSGKRGESIQKKIRGRSVRWLDCLREWIAASRLLVFPRFDDVSNGWTGAWDRGHGS